MCAHGDVALTVAVGARRSTIWSLIRRFEDVATWNPFLASSRLLSGKTEENGAVREVITRDGTVVHEQIVELDDARGTLGYKMLTYSILVVDQHNRIVVAPGGRESLSLVTFSAHFQPSDGALVTDIADMNGAAFIAAANGLGRHLGVDVHVIAVDM